MRILLIIGSDKISDNILSLPEILKESVIVVRDRSTSIKRVMRLILKRRLKIYLVVKMLLCEFLRKKTQNQNRVDSEIASNRDLIKVIDNYKPEKIILFRAGLIINSEIISKGIPIMNIHCARIPEYGGLGSIDKALEDGSLEQVATLHQVTKTIDSGVIYDVESYQLNPNISYCKNEDIAYNAGIRLLKRSLQ